MTGNTPPSDFSKEEIQALEDDLLFLPNSTTVLGKRSVSSSLLSPPTSGTSSGASSTAPSVRHRTVKIAKVFSFDLPESTRSIAALEFIGFTTPAATRIFQRWSSRPNPDSNPDDLIDYVYGNIWKG
jgi:hypothetical protein